MPEIPPLAPARRSAQEINRRIGKPFDSAGYGEGLQTETAVGRGSQQKCEDRQFSSDVLAIFIIYRVAAAAP
jgi:hypothetical protein